MRFLMIEAIEKNVSQAIARLTGITQNTHVISARKDGTPPAGKFTRGLSKR